MSSLVESCAKFTFSPINSFTSRDENPLTLKDRVVFASQILLSAVALPIVALVGLLKAAFMTATCQDSSSTLKVTASYLLAHPLAIFTSLAGAFTTAKITSDVGNWSTAVLERNSYIIC